MIEIIQNKNQVKEIMYRGGIYMEEKFAVEEIKKSNKYCKYIDILGVVLDENEEYTLEEVDKAINDFLESEV